MARRKKKPAASRSPARRSKRAYDVSPYELGMEAWHKADKAGRGNTYKEAKAWLRSRGTRQMRDLFSDTGRKGAEFREGMRDGADSIRELSWLDRSTHGEIFTNPRRRRRNVSASVMRQAKRAGLSERYVRRVAKLKGRGDAPSALSQLKRDHDGNSYWPVRTAHGTHWHYTIKKSSGNKGWYVQFRRRDGNSATHYISRTPTASSKITYYKTKTEAFRNLARHAMKGAYAAYKNPRRRR